MTVLTTFCQTHVQPDQQMTNDDKMQMLKCKQQVNNYKKENECHSNKPV